MRQCTAGQWGVLKRRREDRTLWMLQCTDYISQKGERVYKCTLLLTTPTSYSPLPLNLNSLSYFNCNFPHYFLNSYCICSQTNSFKRRNITKTVEIILFISLWKTAFHLRSEILCFARQVILYFLLITWKG